jgi:hypothetical protein
MAVQAQPAQHAAVIAGRAAPRSRNAAVAAAFGWSAAES